MHRPLVRMIAFLLLAGFVPMAAAAQESSPVDDFVSPDPAACRVTPRTLDDLRGFLPSPADEGTPSAIAAPPSPVPPEGVPADPEIVEAITAVTYELYACLNANDFLRVFALYTDGYMTRSFVSEDIAPEAIDLFGTPIPAEPADKRTSVAVRDVQVLDDGRIGALVVSRSPYADGADVPTYYIFVEQEGRYLVDDIVLPPFDGG